jgi:hypothetical protein
MDWDVSIVTFSMAWWTFAYYLFDMEIEGTASHTIAVTYMARRAYGSGRWDAFVDGVLMACGYDVWKEW